MANMHLSRKSRLGWLRTAFFGTIAATCLTAGTASAGSIEFWTLFSGPDGTAIDQLVKTFNAGDGKAANVEVKLLIIPWDDFNTKLSVAMASRNEPIKTLLILGASGDLSGRLLLPGVGGLVTAHPGKPLRLVGSGA